MFLAEAGNLNWQAARLIRDRGLGVGMRTSRAIEASGVSRRIRGKMIFVDIATCSFVPNKGWSHPCS